MINTHTSTLPIMQEIRSWNSRTPALTHT